MHGHLSAQIICFRRFERGNFAVTLRLNPYALFYTLIHYIIMPFWCQTNLRHFLMFFAYFCPVFDVFYKLCPKPQPHRKILFFAANFYKIFARSNAKIRYYIFLYPFQNVIYLCFLLIYNTFSGKIAADEQKNCLGLLHFWVNWYYFEFGSWKTVSFIV